MFEDTLNDYLKAYNPTYYTQARLNKLTENDKAMAVRQIEPDHFLNDMGLTLELARFDAEQIVAGSGTSGSVPKSTLVYNIMDYGAQGTWNGSTGADDSPALNAAMAALQAAGLGGAIYFPPLPSNRKYRFTQPFPNVSNVRYYGQAAATTQINFTASSMFNLTSGIAVNNVIFEHLYLVAGSSHLINMGATGHFNFARFENCVIDAQSSSIVNQNGAGDFIENLFINCDMYRNAVTTVPAFNIINTGGGANCNVWKKCRAWSNGCTTSPFWKIEASVSGTWAYDNAWESIVGEQNNGGLIHLYSVNGAYIYNTHDYDASTYTDHVIKVDKSSTSTTNSTKVEVHNSGRIGGVLSGGAMDFWASQTSSNIILYNVGNHTPNPVYQVPENSSMTFGPWSATEPIYTILRVKGGALFAYDDAPLTVKPTYPSGRGLQLFEGVAGYAGKLLHIRRFTDTGDRFVIDGFGLQQWGTGDGTFDVRLEHLAAGVIGVGAGQAIRTGVGATGSRPSAVTVGAGSMFYDTTLSKPIWSNGTVWKDATGTNV
jgi:hypothetical protein